MVECAMTQSSALADGNQSLCADMKRLLVCRFAVATPEELLANNDDCAICWDSMTSARKLPCGHLFHK